MHAQFFVNNRLALISGFDNGIVVMSAYKVLQLLGDSTVPFRQEPNFRYLTGITEPDWRLAINTSTGRSILGMPEYNDTQRVFDGAIDIDEICRISGIDEVKPIREFNKYLNNLVKEDHVLYELGEDTHEKYYNFVLNPSRRQLSSELRKLSQNIRDCSSILKANRAIKQPEELFELRHAIDATIGAFKRVRQNLKNKRHEYEVEAEFGYDFRCNNMDYAYEPIVAGGANACTLHYTKNNALLPQNGLVLIDIGARVNGYAADITRTYALGTPSAREVAVHAAVETAHHRIIELIKPGVTLQDYSDQVDEIMKDALQEMGLLEDRNDTKTYRKYFPHAISHGLGLDVHESLGGYDAFMPGMVLTVEPGIYIPEEGIGVRIEDDILVTDDGNENLSGSLSTAL